MPAATPPRPRKPKAPPVPDTLADVLKALGDIPPHRILWTPLPGTATEADQLRYLDGEPKRLVELIDGVLVEKAVGAREGFIAMTLGVIIGTFVRLRNLGMIGGEAIPMRVSQARNRMPDVSFTSWGRLGGSAFRAVVPISPDLAVEVLSPSNTASEIARKVGEYFKAGTQLVWVFDPDAQTVTVYTSPKKSRTLTAADTLDGGKALPGFTLDLNDFWNDPQVAYFPTT